MTRSPSLPKFHQKFQPKNWLTINLIYYIYIYIFLQVKILDAYFLDEIWDMNKRSSSKSFNKITSLYPIKMVCPHLILKKLVLLRRGMYIYRYMSCNHIVRLISKKRRSSLANKTWRQVVPTFLFLYYYYCEYVHMQ